MSAHGDVGGMLDCGDTSSVQLCTLGNLWAHPETAASEEVVREVGGTGTRVQFVGPALHRPHTQKSLSPPAADKSRGPCPLCVSQPSRASYGLMKHPGGLQGSPCCQAEKGQSLSGDGANKVPGAVDTGAKPIPTRIHFCAKPSPPDIQYWHKAIPDRIWYRCKAIPTRNPWEAAPRDMAKEAADAGT